MFKVTKSTPPRAAAGVAADEAPAEPDMVVAGLREIGSWGRLVAPELEGKVAPETQMMMDPR